MCAILKLQFSGAYASGRLRTLRWSSHIFVEAIDEILPPLHLAVGPLTKTLSAFTEPSKRT